MIVIDQERCIGCGVCVADCITQNLEMVDGKANVKRRCVECGHCYALCPQCAVSLPDFPQDGIVDKDEKTADGEALLNLIKMRRSIRQYENRPVEKEVIERILQAGRFTATANNTQDVSYVVVQEDLATAKEYIWEGFAGTVELFEQTPGMEKVAKKFRIFYNRYLKDRSQDVLFFDAPVLLVVTSPSMLNGAFAAATIELMAAACGLGVMYSGFIQRSIVHSEKAQEYFGIKGSEVCTCMLLGYPSVTYLRSVPRKSASIHWK